MTRFGQRGRWRPAAVGLAGAAVLALTGCATAQPEADPLGGPAMASAAGASGAAEPANPESPAGSGNPASRDHAARSSGSSNLADPDQAVSSTDSADPPSRATPADAASLSHCPQRSAFILAMVSDYHGWASPVEAAQQFTRYANVPGYGTPNTVWTAHAPDASGVTLTATDLMLHAIQLPNGRWAIESGQRCD